MGHIWPSRIQLSILWAVFGRLIRARDSGLNFALMTWHRHKPLHRERSMRSCSSAM